MQTNIIKNHTKMREKARRTFGDMTTTELEKWEEENTSLVYFNETKGYAFQKTHSVNSRESGLAIVTDEGTETEVILHLEQHQVNRLKEYLHKHF